MADDPQEMAIVMTIISLARSMDLRVVAEGVETEPQARLLRLIKCNELQGYLFAKPAPAEEIPRLLQTKLNLNLSTAPAAR
jgi:EAL domain-containing protein (putative c-di-GMP-specific phosphodiesterase class I)